MIPKRLYNKMEKENLLSFPYSNIYGVFFNINSREAFQENLIEILKNNADTDLALLTLLCLRLQDDQETALVKELLEFMDSYLRAKGYSEEC